MTHNGCAMQHVVHTVHQPFISTGERLCRNVMGCHERVGANTEGRAAKCVVPANEVLVTSGLSGEALDT